MKSYYEVHITMKGDPAKIEPLVNKIGWKFSAIDGDPILGEGIKCYATMFFSPRRYEQDEVVEIIELVAQNLRSKGINVIREKIELVIWDRRKEKIVCDGNCPCKA